MKHFLAGSAVYLRHTRTIKSFLFALTLLAAAQLHATDEWLVLFDGKQVNPYTEPEGYTPSNPKFPGQRLSKGTLALQGHDPKSVVFFKDIRLRPIP